ncbi:MAG: DUF4239 domain-containing protein [Pseudomonadota bacterium]
MNFTFTGPFLVFAFFFGLLLFLKIGQRIGLASASGSRAWVTTVNGSVFGLLGLLIAFTFSGAATRFEDRRHLITEEANAIGTAYLRIDQLPADVQPEIRALFRHYTELRAITYNDVTDITATNAKLGEAEAIQKLIWGKASNASLRQDAHPSAATLFLPALNEMIDIVTTRVVATENHPPLSIYLLLAGLSLMGSLLIGFEMSSDKKAKWLHMIVFSGVMAIAVYVIIDLEYPRMGLIQIHSADHVLTDLRKGMD